MIEIGRLTPPNDYHEYGTKWWNNEECPYSYTYLDLEDTYSKEYFDSIYHIDRHKSVALYKYMQSIFKQLFNAPFKSVLELGCGGGEITKIFEKEGLKYLAVEGSSSGIIHLLKEKIPAKNVVKGDIRFSNEYYGHYDICMCTEIAEHIEPWFASKIPEVCSRHSDVVWFSAAKGNAPPHYNHPNEAPIRAWDNIFFLYGFTHYVNLNGEAGRADRLYLNEQAIQNICQ